MGKRDFDHDAERAGASIIKTAQMPSGFRAMAKQHLPTARQHVAQVEQQRAEEVARSGFDPASSQYTDEQARWIERRGGPAAVDQCLSFAVWFCQQLIDTSAGDRSVVTGGVALGSWKRQFGTEIGEFLAYWSSENRLVLSLECDCFWREPLGAEALGILVHEAAHARAMHHGHGFDEELERLAGEAARIMFEHGNDVRRRWPEFVQPAGSPRVPTRSFRRRSRTL